MPDKRDDKEKPEKIRPRPFWSGTIAFGLVSLPVSLFPANRGRPYSLKMVDEDGTPLARRFFCEKEDKPIERDDIVRGYEIEKGSYVVVEDEELEALAPEKSREIDLRRFVALDQINPMYFERAYFLVPDEGSTKAYRLLAKSMEDEQRAGIATFVMRGKEYLVAIIAEKGILRAETLRFHDEIRSPDYIGLPELKKADKETVHHMHEAMQELTVKTLDRDELTDRQTQNVIRLVNRKLKSGKDVVRAPKEVAEEYEEESNVIDLMQVLKERLQGRREPAEAPRDEKPAEKRGKGKRDKAAAPRAGRVKSRRAGKRDLEDLSRNELYERAQELDIPGRSRMSKKELSEALANREQ